MDEKTCPHCQQNLPANQYHRHTDGRLQSWCKDCRRQANRERADRLRAAGPTIDQTAIEQAIAGELPAGRLTVAERELAVRRLHAQGLNVGQIARRLRIPDGTARDIRRRLDLPAHTQNRRKGQR